MGNSQGKPRELAIEIDQEEEKEDDHDHGSAIFTCEICIEPTSVSNKFNSFCKHPFCQECIAKYIEVKIKDQTAKIQCPEPSCEHHLDPLTCRPLLSTALFTTWCDVLCEDSLLGSKKSYCPNSKCLSLVLNECRGNVKKCSCPRCKQPYCFRCQTVWHAGCSCEESDQTRDRNDVLFGRLVEQKKWVRCPGCGHCVERQLGCRTMYCRCKTSFCYDCGKKISETGKCGCAVPSGLIVGLITMLILFLLFWIAKEEKSYYHLHQQV